MTEPQKGNRALLKNRYTASTLLTRFGGLIQRHLKTRVSISPAPCPRSAELKNDGPRVRKPVIIVGCGRSGTSMLFNLLAEHRDLVPTRGFPDGEDTETWVRVAGAFMAGLAGGRARTSIGHCLCLPMDGSDITQARISYVHQHLCHEYRSLAKPGQRLLNKNPHLSNKLGFVHQIFPDVRIIHIVRDPRAVIASWKVMVSQNDGFLYEVPDDHRACVNVYPNHGWQDFVAIVRRSNANIYNPHEAESISLLARHWRHVNMYLMQQRNEIHDLHYRMIRYEDLCRDQGRALSQLLEFCELSGKSRWRIRTRVQVNEKWRSELSKEELAIIEKDLVDCIEGLGYQLPSA